MVYQKFKHALNSKITDCGKFPFNGSGILFNSGEITINSTDGNNALLINASSIMNTTEGIINVPNGGLLQISFNRMVDGDRKK